MTRPRACSALICDRNVLMVRHVEPARSYWTLPGCAIEAGETPAQAAVREVYEETGLRVRVVRLLFERVIEGASPEHVYLVVPAGEAVAQAPVVGFDPEDAHLAPEHRLLQDVAWRPLDEMRDDIQISAVLKALEGGGNP